MPLWSSAQATAREVHAYGDAHDARLRQRKRADAPTRERLARVRRVVVPEGVGGVDGEHKTDIL